MMVSSSSEPSSYFDNSLSGIKGFRKNTRIDTFASINSSTVIGSFPVCSML